MPPKVMGSDEIIRQYLPFEFILRLVCVHCVLPIRCFSLY